MTDTVLYLAHTEDDSSLSRASLEALSAAQSVATSLGALLVVGLFGGDLSSATLSIGSCGAARFFAVQGEPFLHPRYSTDAAAAEALARASEATIVIGAHTSRLARVAAGVALRLNGRIDTHVAALDAPSLPASLPGSLSAQRWFYRQRIEGRVQRMHRPWFLLVDSGAAPPFAGPPKAVQPEALAVPVVPVRTETVGLRNSSPGEQTIRPDAPLLFVAGAGWTRRQKDGAQHTEEAERLILDFVRASHASLGSTKSLTEIAGEGQAALHCLTHLNQVGQTGSTPRHAKGLSTCCHGEEPHVVGWRFIRERRAVNLDANCGWARGKADVLYVADAFEVMRHLNALLNSTPGQ